MTNSYETFEDKIRRLATYSQKSEAVSLKEITETLGHSSNYFIILFLVTPFLQPIPLFGFSTVCGFLILLSSLLIINQKPFYLPKAVKRHAIKGTTIRTMCNTLLHFFEMTKGWLHKRGRFMSRHMLLRSLNGFLMFFLGVLLALPLPIPFTNTLPAVSIALLCLGSLKEDGVVIAVGWTMIVITVFYFCFVIALPLHLILE